MKQIGKFGKSFLIFICMMLVAALFTGCPKPTDGNESQKGATIIVESLPDGVKAISFGQKAGDGFLSETGIIDKDKLPYSKTFYSNYTVNGDYIKKGTQLEVCVELESDYVTFFGKDALKVLQNGTALTEQSRTEPFYANGSTAVLNIQQWSNCYFPITLDDNNTITFDKGSLAKLDPKELRLKEDTGKSYLYFSEWEGGNAQINVKYKDSGVDAYGIDCYYGVFACPANIQLEVEVYPYSAYKLKTDSFKAGDETLTLTEGAFNGYIFNVKSPVEGQRLTITRAQEPITDMFALAGKELSACLKKQSDDSVESVTGELTFKFGAFTAGSTENPVTITTKLDGAKNGKYYYKSDSEVEIISENLLPLYTLSKDGSSFVASASGSSVEYYFSSKIITTPDTYFTTIKEDEEHNELPVPYAQLKIGKPDFVGFDAIPDDVHLFIDGTDAGLITKSDKYNPNGDYDAGFYYIYDFPLVNGKNTFDYFAEHTFCLKSGDIISNTTKFRKFNSPITLINKSYQATLGDVIKVIFDSTCSGNVVYFATQTNTNQGNRVYSYNYNSMIYMKHDNNTGYDYVEIPTYGAAEGTCYGKFASNYDADIYTGDTVVVYSEEFEFTLNALNLPENAAITFKAVNEESEDSIVVTRSDYEQIDCTFDFSIAYPSGFNPQLAKLSLYITGGTFNDYIIKTDIVLDDGKITVPVVPLTSSLQNNVTYKLYVKTCGIKSNEIDFKITDNTD